MFRRIKEWVSVFIAKKPARAILLAILLLNLFLFGASALIISALAPKSLEQNDFWSSVFYTISMILDAGCVQYVIADIGQAGVGLIIVCMVTVLIGMITFTGAVIGYVTNYISSFIENSNSGARPLKVSGHTVILNWNSRASEIVNDLLYTGEQEKVIILVTENGEAVKREISDRLATTLKNEQRALKEECAGKPFLQRLRLKKKRRIINRITYIVREGETYSTKQLHDISISQARTVIILGKDIQNTMCKYDYVERVGKHEKGNANTIKTLVQVAEMTGKADSADDQVIIVEVDDEWTGNIVDRIAEHKKNAGKNNIVPVPINKILGQILSQFSIMPELNTVYSELFSNKGAEFYCYPHEKAADENQLIRQYLQTHSHAIPMTLMDTTEGHQAFYVAEKDEDFQKETPPAASDYTVSLNLNYWLSRRNVIIIGHNSKSKDIMNGFNAFRAEWKRKGEEILNLIVIDDEKSLEKYYDPQQYPYVRETIRADVFDYERICGAIDAFIDANQGQDTSILILSDDTVVTEDIDANALTYLVYVQDIIFRRQKTPGFARESIDVVVEILNPKNFDVVHNYSVNNVVISNRYISKMVTQISRKDALYDFYKDILTYDTAEDEQKKLPAGQAATAEKKKREYESKELYIKRVGTFFRQTPGECTAAELIRAVFDASPENNKAVVLGYTSKEGQMHIFSGDQNEIKVCLKDSDNLIVFSNH